MLKARTRQICIAVWILLWPFVFWCFWTPIPFSALKLAAFAALICLYFGAVALFGPARRVLALLCIPMAAVLFWPGQAADSTALASSYVNALGHYRGTRYVWGGENGRGIDCSGLIRRGLIDALLAQGWKSKNPSLWREAAQIWWRDCSAHEMQNGYSGRIKTRFEAVSLNQIDTSRLQIGDLAVLKSGVHVLAFVGGKTWIQADPNLVNGGDKVIFTSSPSKNGWFGQKTVICRWKTLDAG